MHGRHYPGLLILSSGSGTTAEAVIHATKTGELSMEVAGVVSNNEHPGVFDKVDRLNEQYGLKIEKAHITSPQKGEQTVAESQHIVDFMHHLGVKRVVLLGYLRKVVGPLLTKPLWIVNSHPGPLPATGGLIGATVQQRVLDLGLTHSAHTIHHVDEDYDTGQVIAAHKVPVQPGDDKDSLFQAVQSTEKSWTPRVLNDLLLSEQRSKTTH